MTVRYEHIRTCSRFMGRSGQFFAYRIARVENRGASSFNLRPSSFRLPGAGRATVAPVLVVPEFSDSEVAAASSAALDELYLLERGTPERAPAGPVALGYDDPGVQMLRVGAAPVQDEGNGCDGFNT